MLPDFKAGRLNDIGSVSIACVHGKLWKSDEVNLESNIESAKKLSFTDCTEKTTDKNYIQMVCKFLR